MALYSYLNAFVSSGYYYDHLPEDSVMYSARMYRFHDQAESAILLGKLLYFILMLSYANLFRKAVLRMDSKVMLLTGVLGVVYTSLMLVPDLLLFISKDYKFETFGPWFPIFFLILLPLCIIGQVQAARLPAPDEA